MPTKELLEAMVKARKILDDPEVLLRTLLECTNDLRTASRTISDQADLIKKLSEDNLKLVAKLDALAGRNSSTFAA